MKAESLSRIVTAVNLVLGALAASASGVAVAIDEASGLLMTSIDHAGNAADAGGLGGVDHDYRIGAFEVTNSEYMELLMAVARDDPNGLYNETIMTDSDRGGIERTGFPGFYVYAVKPSFEDKPVNGVSWPDAARFCNWLHNGKPIGDQEPGTTEDGAYDLSMALALIVRSPAARYFLPTENEWYKAAYYDPFDEDADAGGTPDYWVYPTHSDSVPERALAGATGDVTNPGDNVANLSGGAAWNGENGNVTTVGGAMALHAWGMFDLAGNVYEMTETPGTPIPPDPPTWPDPRPTRIARGGDFSNAEILASSGLGVDSNMVAEAANFGFRVAACALPADPRLVLAVKEGADVILSWSDPGGAATWSVYRELVPDPSLWGAGWATDVVDGDAGAAGIQYRDVDAIVAGSPLFYRVTAVNACGESALD